MAARRDENELDLLSMRAYARRRGCHPSTVRSAIDKGRLERSLVTDHHGRLRIQPDLADEEWEASTEHKKANRRGARRRRAAGESTGGSGGLLFPEVDAPTNGQAGSSSLPRETAEASLEQLRVRTRLQQLRLQEQLGELVDRDEVLRDAWRIARSLQERLLAIPARAVAELSIPQRKRAALQRRIDEEIRIALDDLAGEIEKLEARSGESTRRTRRRRA